MIFETEKVGLISSKLQVFKKYFEKMRLQLQEDIAEKNLWIHQMQTIMDKLKDKPQTEEFIKEALELNSLLSQQ